MGCAAPNPLHWRDLLSVHSAAVEVDFLNARYRVDPVAKSITELKPDPQRVLTQSFQILLIRYLTSAGGELTGEEITEKDLPSGVTFFRGPHALPVAPVVERFGSDPEAFLSRGRELGAEPAPQGDAAVRFWPFKNIPVTYVLWMADEEFPASVSVLFDRSIGSWFEPDMIFLLVGEITARIIEE
jgi:hypothetical protein